MHYVNTTLKSPNAKKAHFSANREGQSRKVGQLYNED
jgi:hypothetical protein